MRYTKAQKAEIGRRRGQWHAYRDIFGNVTKTVYVCKGCDRICTLDDLEVDHIIPVSLGGPDTLDNKRLLCSKCNKTKGNRIEVKGGKLVRIKPRIVEKKGSTTTRRTSTAKKTPGTAKRQSSTTKARRT